MNKTEFVDAVAKEAGIPVSHAEKALKAVIELITNELKEGNKVQLTGFGTFEAPIKKAHKARNPMTGAVIDIADKRVPKFIAGKTLKDAVK